MVIDLHQGRIAVESREGEGSCFTVRLPSAPALKKAQPVAAAPASAQPPNAERQAAAE